MATHQLNSLSRAQLNQAVQQIVDSQHFWTRNNHVSVPSRAQLRAQIIQGNWPDFPMFSPYAATHDGYSQVRFQGTKHLVHRITFRQAFGRQLSNDLEISHILNCGIRSSSNINPRFMVEETGILNRSRINCFLYLDARLSRSLPYQARNDRYIGSEIGEAMALMAQCRTLHTPNCAVHWEAWMDDHKQQGMADEYAGQTESEAEAFARLSEDDYDEGSSQF